MLFRVSIQKWKQYLFPVHQDRTHYGLGNRNCLDKIELA